MSKDDQLLVKLKSLMENPDNIDAASDEFSTSGGPIDEKGCLFGEDVWSRRLAGCLKCFLPKNFDVKLTCALGIKFKFEQKSYTGVDSSLCECYPFHGSPDLTIKNCPVILGDNASVEERDSGEESNREPECVIENSHQAPQLLSHPTKLGELLSSMHVRLVKKLLKRFIKKSKNEDITLTSRGLFLSKYIGGIICEMSIDYKKNEPAPLNISVDDYGCSVLSPSSLCHHLQRILDCQLH